MITTSSLFWIILGLIIITSSIMICFPPSTELDDFRMVIVFTTCRHLARLVCILLGQIT